MRRQLLLALLLSTVSFTPLATAVSAGGMAVVRLDADPTGVLVDVPWKFGFMVRQHDISPNSDVTPRVNAQHRDTGEKLEATGHQVGPVGHFLAEVTFPLSGEWKWSITPEPYAATSFETLTVYASPIGASAAEADAAAPVSLDATLTARVHAGTCAALGENVPSINDAAVTGSAFEREVGAPSAVPITITTLTLDRPLAELIARDYAIDLSDDTAPPSGSACGEIGGPIFRDELVVGLRQRDGADDAGIALLRGDGERTEITVYHFAISRPVASSDVEIRIVQAGEWAFTPDRVEIAAGTTVTWINDTDTSHTVTGRDLAFADSSPLGPGESFSQRFSEPGTYAYFCGPHPDMAGTIVVTRG